jgi:16S rRNA (cytosine967-C5)-methyltransferase
MPDPHRVHPALLRATAALWQQVVTSPLAADQVVERHFRQQRQMGSRDRRFAAEAIFGCLRWERLLSHFTDHLPADRQAEGLIVAWLLLIDCWSAEQVAAKGWLRDLPQLLERVTDAPIDSLPFAVRHNLSDSAAARLQHHYGEQAEAIAAALNQSAAVDLRVNTLVSDRDTVLQQLAAAGITATPLRHTPHALRLTGRPPLHTLPLWQQGAIEVQDAGSQLIGLIVEANFDELVIDYCAGAGGKSLQLAAMMGDRGEIIACDSDRDRLARLAPRQLRAGVRSITPLLLGSDGQPRLTALTERADRVLVDAPCSASGTWRRNPQLRWREGDLATLTAQQQQILAKAARLVRPGGSLIYATCSLWPEENQQIIDHFCHHHPEFQLTPIAPILARQGAEIADAASASGVMQLLPQRDECDGFFAARLTRRRTCA